jgi:hypothetical protein
MKKELEEKLFNKYPEIFKQKNLSPQETSMCWGIDCDNGWYSLIDGLCAFIQMLVETQKLPQVEAVQVKQKFASLRFYINSGTDEIYNIIHFAEDLSTKICEHCGSMNEVSRYTSPCSWIISLCKLCQEENEKINSLTNEK